MIDIKIDISDAIKELDLLEKDLVKAQKIVQRRLITVAGQAARKDLNSKLTRTGMKKRYFRSRRYPALYGYGNPAPTHYYKGKEDKPTPDAFKIKGVWMRRVNGKLVAVRSNALKPIIDVAFSKGQDAMENAFETEMKNAVDKVIGA